MAAYEPGPLGSWLATLLAPVFFASDITVRIISGIFITLGIAFLVPIVSIVAFDICLWLWRLYALSRNAFLRQQRLLREEQRERRQQQLQKQKLQKLQDLQHPRVRREAQLEVAASTASTTSAGPAGSATTTLRSKTQ